MSNSISSQTRPTAYQPSESDPPEDAARAVLQLVPGEIIAERYRLVRKLGEGGMGVVWVAHSLSLGVDVAIKLIRCGGGDPDLESRMAREAQATALLAHPAIVRVFDHGMSAAGDPFLVMELVQGETLAAYLAREKKLDVVEATKLVLPLLDGLRYAHDSGIIHRDIKPENVLIARDRLGRLQPKLLDFGIAKLEQQSDVSPLTQVGDVLGSPEFMSPEQARGAPDVDARADVWSVCVLLYQLTTGTLPFKMRNYNALMQAILHAKPVPTFDLGAGDKDLWSVIAKGLSKARERRWASMSDLGEALAFWLYDKGETEDVCGNSLKTMWLGGTLTGLTLRPRTDSWADVASDPAVEAEARALPTLRLRFRRLRRRIEQVVSRPVLLGIFVSAALAFTLLLFGLSGGPERELEPTAVANQTAVPSKKPGAQAAATVFVTPQGPPIVAASAFPPAASSSSKKAPRPAVRTYRAPTERAPGDPRKKRTRDYGL
jgi:serine/threonine-protein kinase